MWAVWHRVIEQRELSRLSYWLREPQASTGSSRKGLWKKHHYRPPCWAMWWGVWGPRKSWLGLLNSSYIATEALSCIDKSCWIQKVHALKYRFLYEILSGNWLTDGGSAEGLCLARADFFWAPSSLWLTSELFFLVYSMLYGFMTSYLEGNSQGLLFSSAHFLDPYNALPQWSPLQTWGLPHRPDLSAVSPFFPGPLLITHGHRLVPAWGYVVSCGT